MAMAASITFKHLPFFFLLLSSVQIEARVNKFFSKFIHTDHDVVLPVAFSPAPVSAPPEISPSLAPTPAPAPFFDESQNAYGLYGRDSDDDESSRTITDVEEEILAEDGEDEESHKSGYQKTNLPADSYESPRGYESNNYENNGYRNSEFENNNEHRNSEYQKNNGYRNFEYQNNNEYRNSEYQNNNGYRNSEYQNNNEYKNSEYHSNFENNGVRNYQYESNFEDDGYRKRRYEPTEQQGMSDTRFMENGRYYHDNNSGIEKENKSYENKKYPNEFDSMEEYEKSEGFLP